MRKHVKISIRGLEDRINGKVSRKYGTWEILQDDKGRFLTKQEVREEIEKAKAGQVIT